MTAPPDMVNRRILVIDDNIAIHEDFRKILQRDDGSMALHKARAMLFEQEAPTTELEKFDVDCADQGQTGFAMVEQALRENRPYATAFVDMRMPPGWDGVETIEHLWHVDPALEVVICTAFSDLAWHQVIRRLGRCDKLLVLRKPFDHIEVWQLAASLTRKWTLAQQAVRRLDQLDVLVRQRTAALQEANERLRLELTQRTRLEAELAGARDKALAATHAKSAFLATMSHEIRTPMNGAIGMTTLLLDTALTDEQREYVEVVQRCGEHLLALINGILDFSKIEAGKLDLESMDFDLCTVVEEVVELLAEKSYNKGLELTCLVHATVPTALCGDPSRLCQILTNLLSNAIKFTDTGEVIVRVTCGDHSSLPATHARGEGQRAEGLTQQTGRVVVRVEVTDTGIGLTPEQTLHLFQPFSQAHSSITRQYGGTGLGLAICKQLVELMGGQIGVESQPGQGSTFWFTACLATQPPAGIAEPQPHGDLSAVRVLIVDDHATSRAFLQHLTASWGMQCASAEDGPQALALLRAAVARGEAYAVALLDLLRPGIDDFALARAIKADPVIAVTRLVLLTPFGQRGDSKLLHQAGAAASLTKPVRQTQLRQCLAAVMGIPPAGGRQPMAEGCLPTESTPHTAPLTPCHTLTAATGRSCPRVLVAEDNIVNQKVAVHMLEKLGYQADVVANGLQALAALVRVPYAGLLMDCHMPEMDGFEATREIRRREAVTGTQRLPIIAVTASARQVDREKCLAAGMDAYISKPVQLTALDAVLQCWIQPLAQGSLQQDDKNTADTCVEQVCQRAEACLHEIEGALQNSVQVQPVLSR